MVQPADKRVVVGTMTKVIDPATSTHVEVVALLRNKTHGKGYAYGISAGGSLVSYHL